MPLSLYPEIAISGYVMALGVVFLGAIVQSTMGMGFGQVAAPLLLLINTNFVPVSVLIMGMTVAALSSVRTWRSVALSELGLALGGRIIGSVVAATVLISVSDHTVFSLLFAVLILLAVALSLCRWHVLPTRRALLLAGSASGFMGTITSVGAPPMGLVYQHSPGAKVRATLNAFFTLGSLASLAALGLFGFLRMDHLLLSIALAPALIAGTWISKYLTSYVDQRFRILVLGICVFASLAVIWNALT